MTSHRARIRRLAYRTLLSAVLVACLSAAVLATGCGEQKIDVPPVSTEKPAEPKAPKAADLSTPRAAVQSYLDFITYAYRLGNSDVASQTMGPEELMRVDSYIELDRQRGRKIEQQLDAITFGAPIAQGANRQLVPASEKWTYRYIDSLSGTYKGPAKKASFDATYTVDRADSGWLVVSVEATTAATGQ